MTIVDQPNIKPEITDVRHMPEPEKPKAPEPTTSTTTDKHGNKILETTDIEIIKSSKTTQAVIKESLVKMPELASYEIKYDRKVKYSETVSEVTLIMEGTDKSAPVQVVSMFDKTAQTTKIISTTTLTSPIPKNKKDIAPVVDVAVVSAAQMTKATESHP